MRRIPILLLANFIVFSAGFIWGQTTPQPVLLEAGKSVERAIAGGESHIFQINIVAGQFIQVSAEQNGIDIGLTLNAPDGKQLADATFAGGPLGHEQISCEAAVSGDYRLVVKTISNTAIAGAYQLKLEVKATASAKDKQQITAERLLTEAIKLNVPGPSGVDPAIEKAQQALALWHEMPDLFWEASALNIIGNASLTGKKYDQAIEYYRRALTIRRELKDRVGEGNTLNNLALTYRLLNRREEAIDNYQRSFEIKHELKDRAGEANALTNLGANNFDLSRFEKAIDYYGQALAIRREIKDRAGEGVSLNNIGNVYRTIGQSEKALEYFDQALQISREVKDRVGEGKALNVLGAANYGLSRYDKAISYFEQALQISREVKDRAGEGNALNNIGGANYGLSRFEKAISYYEPALIIRREVSDRIGEATTLSNLGVMYQSLGHFEKSIEYCQQAIAINRELKNRYGESQALTNLGNAYKDLGRSEKALECYEQALAITRDVKDRAGETAALNNLGAANYDLGNYEKGIEYQKLSLAVARELKNRAGEGQALSNLGGAYNALGRYEEALRYYDQALVIFREVKNRDLEAVALNGLGYVNRTHGQNDQARGQLEEALAIAREIKNRQGEADPLNNLGAVYAALGNYEKAAADFEQALVVRREVKDRLGEAFTLHSYATLERDKGDLARARTLIEQALQIVESSRAAIYNPQLRASYFASTQKYYQFYIDLLMRLNAKDPSHGFDALAVGSSERARARGLLELLTESGTDIRQGVDAALLERERSLSQQLNAKAASQIQLLNQGKNAEQAATVKQEISQLENDLGRVQADIRKASPHYAALVQPQPLTLKEVQAQLDADTLLLEFSLGTERSYLWAITQHSLTTYELPKEEQIKQSALQVYEVLTARNGKKAGETTVQRQARINQAEAKLPAAALALSKTILAPAAAQLGKKRLVIVADGALQYIPFAMLPDPAAAADQPLIVGHEVVSLPSASVLAIQRTEIADRLPAQKMLAVIADPVFDRTDLRVKAGVPEPSVTSQVSGPTDTRGLEHIAEASDDGSSRMIIRRLAFTRQEADALLALAPKATSLREIDFQANRTNVMNGDLAQYRYVHFATHGLLDSERPGLSALVLSTVDADGKPRDGFLRANDIYNMKLPAELVVLSACQTGLGKEVKGEGLIGLTRGFMYAGAKRVVVSLWSVNDKATADLMTTFYSGMLKRNERPAAALRAAQIEMWKQKKWQSPYYWAAFTMQGEWR